MNIVSRKYTNFIIIASLFVDILGISVVLGWILNVSFLKSILPDYVTMKFNTSWCFIFISASLFLQVINTHKTWHQLSTLFFLIVLVYGILSLSQGLFNYNLGIDHLFVTDFESIASNYSFPGRMSSLTAICFTLMGFAFAGIRSRNEKVLKLTQILLHTTTLLAFIAIMGYLFNVPVFYKLSFLTSMAVHTAIAFFLLSVAASLINPTLFFTGLFTGNKIGNFMARKLFLQLLVTILILTYIRIITNRYSPVSVDMGIVLLATSFILTSLFLIWIMSSKLNRVDFKKTQVEDNLADLTKLKERLQKSNGQLFRFFNLNPVATTITKINDSKIKFVNDTFLKLFSLERANVLEKTAIEANIITDKVRTKILEHLHQNGMKLKNFELKLKDGNGKMIDVLMSNEVIEIEGETHFIATLLDISERKKAEEKNRQLAIIIDSSIDAIISKTLDGVILTWNKGAQKILGYSSEEVIGKHISLLFPPELIQEEAVLMKKIIDGEHVDQYETIRVRKDKIKIAVAITLSPITDDRGNIIAVSKVLRDITYSKEQEEKLRKYSILEAKSKEMEQLTYIASHDLRHPLLTILNYIKIFDEDYADKLDEEGKYCLQSISGAATRMDKLILGLLDYARLSKMKELETVNCNEIIQAVIADLNSTIKSTNAKIIVSDLPAFRAYPIELRQLFQNLVTNALKFKKAGIPPELIISAKKDKEGYCFEFRDNGIGIEKKDIEKLFLIFQRLHTIEEYEGTGLGLAYCKKIVELHHGQIWVKSKPNEGSSFYFTIKT